LKCKPAKLQSKTAGRTLGLAKTGTLRKSLGRNPKTLGSFLFSKLTGESGKSCTSCPRFVITSVSFWASQWLVTGFQVCSQHLIVLRYPHSF
jgi:hypothetical protein